MNAQFENWNGEVQAGFDASSRDYVVCPSNHIDKGYVGVHAIERPGTNNKWVLRGIEFDDSGVERWGTYNVIELNGSPGRDLQIHPLKIVQRLDGNGYYIVGYVIQGDFDIPFPFVIKTDNNLDVVTNGFKTFTNHGFFCDVDELPNNDLMFCGSKTEDLQLADNDRVGILVRTSSTFTISYMKYIDHYTSTTLPENDYDIVHDLILVDDDAVICGNVSEQYIDGACTTSVSRPFIARINLTNGNWTGAGYWINTRFKGIGNSTASRLAEDGTQVVMATHALATSSTNLLFYNITTGAFISGKNIEFNSTTINDGTIYTHVPFIQNIYFNSNGDIFMSGKNIKIGNSWNSSRWDMPFNAVYDVGNNSVSGIVYPTDQQYLIPADYLNYEENTVNCFAGMVFPFYAASNTIPEVNGNTDEYTTITHDHAKSDWNSISYANKTWIFSNDNSTCNNAALTGPDPTNVSTTTPIVVSNFNLLSLPDVLNLTGFDDTGAPFYFNYDCDSDPH